MMNPEMMKTAADMMAKMSPEDMKRMMEMSKNLDPSMLNGMMNVNPAQMAQAQQQMQNMSSEDMKRMSDQMANMSPTEMARAQQQAAALAGGAPSASAVMGPTTSVASMEGRVCDAVLSLVRKAEKSKAEGNGSFKAQQFDDAIAQYKEGANILKRVCDDGERLALLSEADVKGDLGKPDRDFIQSIKTACHLNAANCFTKAKDFGKAVGECDEVLKAGDHRKAFYRRAQALMGQELWEKAEPDLLKAAQMDPSDSIVTDALKTVRGKLGKTDEPLPTPTPSPAPSSSTATPAPVLAGEQLKPENMQQAAEQLKNMSPDQVAKAQESLKNMDPDTMARMAEQMQSSGMAPAGIDANQMKMATEMMKNMKPEDFQAMGDMMKNIDPKELEKMGGGGGGMAQAAKMMQNMPPDMLSKMGGMMGNISPEQMAKAQEQMASMDPEKLEKWMGRAQKVAGFAQYPMMAYQKVRWIGAEHVMAACVAGLGVMMVGYYTEMF